MREKLMTVLGSKEVPVEVWRVLWRRCQGHVNAYGARVALDGVQGLAIDCYAQGLKDAMELIERRGIPEFLCGPSYEI